MKVLLVIFTLCSTLLTSAQENTLLKATGYKSRYIQVGPSTWNHIEIFRGTFVRDSLLDITLGGIAIKENPKNKYWTTIVYGKTKIVISYNEEIEVNKSKEMPSTRITVIDSDNTIANYVIMFGDIKIDKKKGTIKFINIISLLEIRT